MHDRPSAGPARHVLRDTAEGAARCAEGLRGEAIVPRHGPHVLVGPAGARPHPGEPRAAGRAGESDSDSQGGPKGSISLTSPGPVPPLE